MASEAPETVIATVASQYLATDNGFITGKVLDVGCGSKPHKRLFPDCEWVGIDTRPVGEVLGDAEQLPFDDGSFDTVLCVNVLHLVESPVRAMREMARVLKPGGHLVVIVPNTAPEDSETLWCIKVRGLDYLISKAGLRGVNLLADGTLIAAEWSSMTEFEKYRLMIPGDVEGWLGQMNARYPAVTAAIAVKE